MVRVYKNDTAYIACEVKIFKNGISYGTTNNMINESYIKQKQYQEIILVLL